MTKKTDSLRKKYADTKKQAKEIMAKANPLFKKARDVEDEAKEIAKKIIFSEGWLEKVVWKWIPLRDADHGFYLDGGSLHVLKEAWKREDVDKLIFFWDDGFNGNIELAEYVDLEVNDNDIFIKFREPEAATAFLKVHRLKLDLSNIEGIRQKWERGLKEINKLISYAKSLST